MRLPVLCSLTLLLLGFLLANRLLRERISAQSRYIAGLLLTAAFLFPFHYPIFDLPVPEWVDRGRKDTTVFSVETNANEIPFGISEADEITDAKEEAVSQPFFSDGKTLLLVFYGVGFGVVVILSVREWLSFRKAIRRLTKAPPEEMRRQMKMLCGKMGIKRTPRLKVCCPAVAETLGVPFTFGIFRPTIVMPYLPGGEESEMLLEHELTHCRRHDAIFRFVFSWLRAAYWFYPPVLLLTDTLLRLCEEACDETVADGKNTAYRQAYGKLLVRYASHAPKLSVSFSNTGKRLKQRITVLFSRSIRTEGTAMILATLVAIVALMGTTVHDASYDIPLMTGQECLENVDALPSEVERELVYAFRMADQIEKLSLRSYYDAYDEASVFHTMDVLFYENSLITAVIAEDAEGNVKQTHTAYCDRTHAERCVGVRLVYEGEEASKRYLRVEILSDRELLSHYAGVLLNEDVPSAITEVWEMRLLLAAEESMVPKAFCEELIDRVK